MYRGLGVAIRAVDIAPFPLLQPRRVNASDAAFHVSLNSDPVGQIDCSLAYTSANIYRIVVLRRVRLLRGLRTIPPKVHFELADTHLDVHAPQREITQVQA